MRWLLYTSGTTSDPKGHATRDAAIDPWPARWPSASMSATVTAPLVFPFPHIGGITWMVLTLQFGVALVFEEAFDAKRTPRYFPRRRHPRRLRYAVSSGVPRRAA